ncbi:MAG: hemolysin III family protein [Thermoanaerobaculia bacterium]
MYYGERFNAISHLVGASLALVGAAVLIPVAVVWGDARRTTAAAIYAAMLCLLYLSSTLYHSLKGRAKDIFRVFDHCAIYLLIAGTYTPLALVTLRGPVGWTLFAIVWGLAVAGIAKDVFLHGRFRVISVVLYLVMGWLVIAAFEPLKAALPFAGLAWLVAGGIVYTLGVIFYAMSKKVPHSHGVWHLCVLGGSACHYVVVLLYVAIA